MHSIVQSGLRSETLKVPRRGVRMGVLSPWRLGDLGFRELRSGAESRLLKISAHFVPHKTFLVERKSNNVMKTV